MGKKIKIKRLYYDIETSPNIVFSWSVGNNINLDYDNIIQERAVICVCWKWEGEDKVYSLQWNKGDDKHLIMEFLKVLVTADEIVGHNSTAFDLAWLRTRALYHGVKGLPEFKSVDTLAMARKAFRFNSNRLDYISKFLGHKGKIKTTFKLWKDIVLDNNAEAMNKMVIYCKKDVVLLEDIYQKLSGFVVPYSHAGVVEGRSKCSCPYCGNEKTVLNKRNVSAKGMISYTLHCNKGCGKYYNVSEKVYLDRSK